MKGLMIAEEPIEKILGGRKDWELRGRRTAHRGPLGLIKIGSGTVVGTCKIVDVVGPLSLKDLKRNALRHLGLSPDAIKKKLYPKTYAWVLEDVKRVRPPVPYRHRRGQQVWVRLSRAVAAKLR